MTAVNLVLSDHQFGDEPVRTASGRDIHAELGIAKDYSTWVKAQIKRGRFVEGRDYVVVTQKGENPAGGRPSAEYHFTIDAGKHIAMMSNTDRGFEVREYFLACERQAQGTALQIKDPLIAATILALTRVDAVEQEQRRQAVELARIAETVAVIEARTQPENKHFTVMGYANLIGRPVDVRAAATLGRRCAALSRQRGLVIGDVSDPRFGHVHSYHESVLMDVLQCHAQPA